MADLNQVVSIEDLRGLARRRLPRAIFDFFDGGAEDEVTLRENRAAFERVRLLPKVLVNVAGVDMKVPLLGREATIPLAIAPTGGISAGRAGAEVALARAAKAFGVPFTLATPAAVTIERVAEEVGGRLWFQLYAVREHEFREKLIARASNAGYEAMLVTVDLPVSGKRERDPRNGFRTPYNPNWRNSRDVIFKPAWLWEIVRHGLPGMAKLDGAAPTLDALPHVARAVGSKMIVLLDGGVRRGVDILKARALGAHGVLTGRATLFGAMAGGEAGARRALEILASELERSMQLCGVRSVADISAQLLSPNS